MEEELANLTKCRDILEAGLRFNRLNENLFLKKIKTDEREKKYEAVRSSLAQLKNVPLDKSWKLMLQGALFEGRVGNVDSCRTVISFLVQKCRLQGQIFYEASKFEERIGCLDRALRIADEGLDSNDKYSPLWFQYLRLFERTYKGSNFESEMSQLADDASSCVSQELLWKFYVDIAEVF